MTWIRERDALIAQTLAFVQSVTGGKDDVLQPDGTTLPRPSRSRSLPWSLPLSRSR